MSARTTTVVLASSLALAAGVLACPPGSEGEQEIVKQVLISADGEQGEGVFVIDEDDQDVMVFGDEDEEVKIVIKGDRGGSGMRGMIREHLRELMGRQGERGGMDPGDRDVEVEIEAHARFVGPDGEVHEFDIDLDEDDIMRELKGMDLRSLFRMWGGGPRQGQAFRGGPAPFDDAIPGRGPQAWATASASPSAWVGIGLGEAEPSLLEYLGIDAETGTVVKSVAPDSPGERAGMRIKDIIVGVQGESGAGPDAIIEAVRKHEAGDTLVFSVYRDGNRVQVAVELEDRPGVAPAPVPNRFFEAVPDIDPERMRRQVEERMRRFSERVPEWGDRLSDAMEERLDELEDRFERLEDMLDTLIDRIEDRREPRGRRGGARGSAPSSS